MIRPSGLSLVAPLQSDLRKDEAGLEVGSIDWWNEYEKLDTSAATEVLDTVTRAVTDGTTEDPEVSALVTKLTDNFRGDVNLHQIAYARSQMSRLSSMQRYMDWTDDQVMRWNTVRPLTPEVLIRWRDSLQRSIERSQDQIVAAQSAAGGVVVRPGTEIMTPTDERKRESSEILRSLIKGVNRRIEDARKAGTEEVVSATLTSVELRISQRSGGGVNGSGFNGNGSAEE